MKIDSNNFLKSIFLEIAVKNEALLYGVVGVSDFQRTLRNPEGKIQDFLQYYNQAVSLLLKSLRKGGQRTTGTLLAILQLAAIEVGKERSGMHPELTDYRSFWAIGSTCWAIKTPPTKYLQNCTPLRQSWRVA
jgi:signal transduction histidine kinase